MGSPSDCTARPHERPGGGHDDQDDQGGPQQQQEQMPQFEAPRALPLGLAQIADRRELRFGGHPPLEQMQQRRDRRGGEPEQRQRMQEAHARRRSAMPNGRSVRTW